MQKKRHPLDSVEELRTRQVDDEARSLAEKRRETEAAVHAESRALNHLVSVTRAIETIKEEETSRLASSGARAGDLAVQAAWSVRATEEVTVLQHKVDEAEQERRARETMEEAQRSVLALKQAEKQAVESHQRAHRQAESRRTEAKEEDERTDTVKRGVR